MENTQVVSVSPMNLSEILASFQVVANALEVPDKGKRYKKQIRIYF